MKTGDVNNKDTQGKISASCRQLLSVNILGQTEGRGDFEVSFTPADVKIHVKLKSQFVLLLKFLLHLNFASGLLR